MPGSQARRFLFSPKGVCSLEYKPIVEMFWCAEYANGLAFPEYDELTGAVNSFSHVNHRDVLRFWWLPVTPRMVQVFPNLRVNPLLRRHAIDLNGSKGFVARRIEIKLGFGRFLKPLLRVKCYILGIEGGPRREIYPDGSIIDKEYPDSIGETQELLHG